MKGSKQKGAKARGKSSSKAIEKIPKLPEYKVHKELSQKEINRLATINMPIVARYQDDGGIAVNLNLDDDSPYIKYSSAEIANTLNELARLSKARKGSIGKEELSLFVNIDVVFTHEANLSSPGSFSGFSQTASGRSQFRNSPDHRFGFALLAAA